MTNPKKWTEVYPYGTKEGDEEAKFFKELARNPKYEFRSVSHLIKSTGLSRDRVEEIISKYAEETKPPLLYPHPTNDDNWGYWERCPDQVKTDNRGISRKDKDQRIDKQLGVTPSMTGDIGVDTSVSLTDSSYVCMATTSHGLMSFFRKGFEEAIKADMEQFRSRYMDCGEVSDLKD